VYACDALECRSRGLEVSGSTGGSFWARVTTLSTLFTKQHNLVPVKAVLLSDWEKPNSITLACSELVRSWLRTGSEPAPNQLV